MLDFSFADPRLLFPDISESLALILEHISTVWYFISLVLIVLGEWKLFKKFGEKPWKSIVPFYNTYLVYKRTWGKRFFWVFLFTSVLFDVALATSKSVAQRSPDSGLATVLVLSAVPLGIITAICSILYARRISEAFGKGKLFFVGLLVIYPIFIAILGFDRSRYVAPFGKPQVKDIKETAESEMEVV